MDPHIIFSYALTGPRAGQQLDGPDIAAEVESPNLAWVHLDAGHPDTRDWMRRMLPSLAAPVIDALTAEETRPRATRIGDGLLVILRGVNTNEGAEPEDMVSIRLWIEPARIVSMRVRRIRAATDIESAIRQGQGPDGPGAFLAMLMERLIARIEPVINALEDQTYVLEEEVVDGADKSLRRPITEVRRDAIQLRRHIAPQREATAHIRDSDLAWITPADRTLMAEVQDRLTRAVEDLDEVRERAQIVKDELANALDERLSRNTYVLSVIAALFLPLGFLTGLLGINVGGIPGSDDPNAFWVFCAILAAVVAVQIWVFRKMRWF